MIDATTMRSALVDAMMAMHPNPKNGLTREEIEGSTLHIPDKLLEICSEEQEIANWVRVAVAMWALCEREIVRELCESGFEGHA